jgi:hypothetical protein
LWCHIFLNNRHEDFNLVPTLIGRGGHNTKTVNEATGAKVRIRGKGSGHKEVDGAREAPVPLMVAITSDVEDTLQFARAVQMMTTVLDRANAQFGMFCKQWNVDEGIASEDMYRYGEMCKEAENVLSQQGLLQLAPQDSSSSNIPGFPPPIPSGHTTRPPIEHTARTPLPTIMETVDETINDGLVSNDTNSVGLSDRMSDDEAIAEHIESEVLAFLSEAASE